MDRAIDALEEVGCVAVIGGVLRFEVVVVEVAGVAGRAVVVIKVAGCEVAEVN